MEKSVTQTTTQLLLFINTAFGESLVKRPQSDKCNSWLFCECCKPVGAKTAKKRL